MSRVIVEPRVVEAGRGFAWWSEGWRIFRSSMGTWIGVFIVYVIVSALVSIVPFVGAVAHSLLTPVFVGGLMMGCRALDHGEPLRMSHLFEGFQGTPFVPLMTIGAVNIALVLGLMALTSAGVIGTANIGSLGSFSDPMDALRGSALALTGTTALVMILVLLLASVFMMLNWFAPALVALRGVPPIQAMKLSFIATLRNWVPFLLYGLAVVIAGVALLLAFAGVAFVFGAGAMMNGSVAGGMGAVVGLVFLLFIGGIFLAIVFGPIAIGSIYAGFKDTLDDDDATVTNPARW